MVPHLNAVEHFIIWAFLIYVIACSGAYFILNLIAFYGLRSYLSQHRTQEDDSLYTGDEPPITVIVPAYNEGTTIISSLQSILQLAYPRMEVVVVNDGSKDNTLDVLIAGFDFEPFPEAIELSLPCNEIRQVYLSRKMNNLRLVDKVNGGKADAINAGINVSRSPLFCCIDADSVLEPSSLVRLVQPFLNNPETIATGGTVRIANGCIVRRGHIIRRGIPASPLATFQLVEYLRAFLFGRLAWSRIKGLLIISGAFGLFRKDVVIRAGGYTPNTIGEDMELLLRMYRTMIDSKQAFNVEFVPDPVCWTEAPETLKVFASQRKRWHRGLSESLLLNRQLLFNRRSGTIGWVAFPFFILFEWLSPIVELAGYVFSIYLLAMGRVELIDAGVIFMFAVLLSVLLSTVSFILDDMTFPDTTRIRDFLVLTLYSFLESFGYRQLNMYYKLLGLWAWATNTKHKWGEMTRTGSWQKKKTG